LRQSFYELVLELAAGGTAVLLASHALSELEERADRVLIMDRGILVADGSVEDLRRIAQLPSRIRVKGPQPRSLPDGIPEPRDIGRKGFEIEVPDLRKVEVARALLCGDNPPEDIELVPPSLDELYAHFLRTRGAA
jgi:Cu-processing system ATP-binding protein